VTDVVPEDNPATVPDEIPIDATEGMTLVQVPAPAGSLSVVVFPWHTVVVPVIAASGSTVTIVVAIQPRAVVYWIVALPADSPVAMPVVLSIVAIAVLVLLHLPPGVASFNMVVNPSQTVVMPVTVDSGSTVNDAVVVHPAEVV
jgi:hypothetical protein